ncbi:MAG: hypothetical protein HC888_17080 [Candidatus Competibacteraceae bacterium]|nr:hypothetical protein [Candidatus Competibacteraceae bacterium]
MHDDAPAARDVADDVVAGRRRAAFGDVDEHVTLVADAYADLAAVEELGGLGVLALLARRRGGLRVLVVKLALVLRRLRRSVVAPLGFQLLAVRAPRDDVLPYDEALVVLVEPVAYLALARPSSRSAASSRADARWSR